jgi:hypothetical protein
MKAIKLVVLVLFVALLAGCAVSANMKDGYQPGDIANGMIENKAFYCSPPYRGIRAVGRFIIRVMGGVTVPDACSLIDDVAGETDAE